MSRISALVLKFQEIVKDQDPCWFVREEVESTEHHSFLTVTTSYPLDPETCGEITRFFRKEFDTSIVEVRFAAGGPPRTYRKDIADAKHC